MKPANEGPIQMRELLQICETEGNAQNGGGSFIIEEDHVNGVFVKYEPGNTAPTGGRPAGAPGEIGSPMMASQVPAFGGPRGFQAQGGSLASPSAF